jgi:hypothetical protein
MVGYIPAALEQHGLARATRYAQQGVVLHVARADLQHIGVAAHEVHVVRVEHLGHDCQAKLVLVPTS